MALVLSWLAWSVVGACVPLDSLPAKRPLRWWLGRSSVVQIGLQRRPVVLSELRASSVEFVARPLPGVAIGYRVGRLTAKARPDILGGARGQVGGPRLRLQTPYRYEDGSPFADLYAEVGRTKGKLAFSTPVYAPSASGQREPVRRVVQLAGDIRVTALDLLLGTRIYTTRYTYVDAAVGLACEDFRLDWTSAPPPPAQQYAG